MRQENGSPAITTEAVEEMFKDYAPLVHRVALRIVNDDDAADDVVGEVFIRLLRSLRAVRPGNAYFTIAARNEALHLHSRSNRWRRRLDALHSMGSDQAAGPEAEVERDQQRVILRHLITRLPPRCRQVHQLIVDEGLSQREAAERLGIRLEAVQKQVSRGRRLLLVMAADLTAHRSIGTATTLDGGCGQG